MSTIQHADGGRLDTGEIAALRQRMHGPVLVPGNDV